MDKLNVILDKVITYTNLAMPVCKITFAEQNPLCHPVKPPAKSAEEMLKKALEFANQGMDESDCNNYEAFADGKYVAYEDMAAHLEMLIEEAKQNG